MAYGNYFPVTYQPYYGNAPYYQQNPAMMQQNQQMQQAQQAQAQQPTIQQSGFVPVRSEQEARAYPVAPGNSVTFKDENAPYCYVKTMGFNQLDQPTFERYRLVKEESPTNDFKAATSAENKDPGKDIPYALKSDLSAIWSAIDDLKDKVKAQAEKKTVKVQKVKEEENE